MADLEYDTERLRSVAAAYRKVSTDLITIKSELQSEISELQNNYWRSYAGDAFMDMYQSSWAENVEKYCGVLEEMAKLLERAAGDYDEVTAKLKQIPGVGGGGFR